MQWRLYLFCLSLSLRFGGGGRGGGLASALQILLPPSVTGGSRESKSDSPILRPGRSSSSSSSSSGASSPATGSSLILSPTSGGEESGRAGGSSPPSSIARSVYLHMPFCRRRCFYCDFPIKVIGDSPKMAEANAQPYIADVLREIRATRDTVYPHVLPASNQLQTIFFGGGTPSLIPPALLAKVMHALKTDLGGVVAEGAEVCMEMDPGTFDEDKLLRFLDLGLTRVSMGVQSFDAALLTAAGRAHSLSDVYKAVELMHKTGFDNFSIDLISGLPEQTMKQWDHSLTEAVDAGAGHVSVYDLQVEEGTAFGHWYAPGVHPLPSDKFTADMYRQASGVLRRAGYDHYEISNYGKPGLHSQHNRVYWEGKPFFAFGNGATSFIEGRRFARPTKLDAYSKWVGELEEVGWRRAACEEWEGEGEGGEGGAERDEEREEERREMRDTTESMQEELLDGIMLGLRLSDGVNLTALTARHGKAAVRRVREAAREAVDGGLAEDDGHTLRLTDPEGFLVSNHVISTIFAGLD